MCVRELSPVGQLVSTNTSRAGETALIPSCRVMLYGRRIPHVYGTPADTGVGVDAQASTPHRLVHLFNRHVPHAYAA